MNRYIAGNSIKNVIDLCKKIKNKKPIINYISENTIDENLVYKEYNNLLNNINSNYKIALKLSSLNFNTKLIDKLVKNYKAKNIKLIIDAEDNNNIDKYRSITNDLMYRNNSTKLNIIKTYQMYRQDSLDELRYDINNMKRNNKFFGNKLVRGAYYNSDKKYNVLFDTKQKTDDNFNKGLYLCNDFNTLYNIIATHNKKSIELAIHLNNQKNHDRYIIAHLMGMNEHYMKTLEDKKIPISVYIPYGSYKESIPYMTRRLYENIDSFKYLFT